MNDWTRRLINQLELLHDRNKDQPPGPDKKPDQDRAALATLRRGLSEPPGAAVLMYEYVEPYLPLRTRADRDRLTLRETHEHEAAYLVASLFALANSGRDVILREEGNFGRSMLLLKHAVVRPESVDDGRNPVDRRFIALLNAPWEDLPVHLRSVVSQLRAKDIGVNWHRLLEDLLFWTLPDRDVQRRWARRFWSEIKVADTREDDAVHTLQNAVGAEAPTDAADSL